MCVGSVKRQVFLASKMNHCETMISKPNPQKVISTCEWIFGDWSISLFLIHAMTIQIAKCVNGCLLCVFFLSSPCRSSSVSVVFDFSASLNDVAPVCTILLPVDEKRNGKRVNCWWMSFVCLLLSSPLRLSWVSVVFDFNDSLNDVAPVSPILLPECGYYKPRYKYI